jgi:hypothetical protein
MYGMVNRAGISIEQLTVLITRETTTLFKGNTLMKIDQRHSYHKIKRNYHI